MDQSQLNYPEAPFFYLETLWFQVAGTLCNLECAHCLVSANPTNKTHLMMSFNEVKSHLHMANQLGVKEYYFTGGEPFMNRDIILILEETLKVGPANVLTNGTFINDKLAKKLRDLHEASPYSLELRISLDGTSAETNDPIRGQGSFDRILSGISHLSNANLNPIITITEAAPELSKEGKSGREKFYALLASLGIKQPRIKILSLFHIGEEVKRTHGYEKLESLRGLHLTTDDFLKLQCTNSRMVTHEGVWVCPILINEPTAKMAQNVPDSLQNFPLQWNACFTCYQYGVTCRT